MPSIAILKISEGKKDAAMRRKAQEMFIRNVWESAGIVYHFPANQQI